MRFQIATAFLLSTTVLAQDDNSTSFTDTPMMGGGLLGANQCNYGLNETCYPNPITPGRPLCCTIDPSGESCESNPMPCFSEADIPTNFTTDFNMTDLPFDSIIGELGPVLMPEGDMTGTSICTFPPDKVCYPATGWPSCCDTDPSSCPSTEEFVAGVNPPCEEDTSMMGGGDMPVMGGSICTFPPDKVCYPATGWPSCCDTDPSSCPSTEEFVAGVNPPCEEDTSMMGGGDMPVMGGSICTFPPDKVCYPATGWPSCCDTDPSSCPSTEEFVAGVNPPCEEDTSMMGGGDMPVMGGSICTFPPDKVCYPATGWPSCCDTDPSSCPSTEEFVAGVNPPCEEDTSMMGGGDMPVMGGSICTFPPDKVCYPATGWPSCCATDPSSCPSTEEFVAGVNPPCEEDTMMGGNGMLGSNQCTYGLNETCYPNPITPGRPLCCTIDPSGQMCDSNPMPCFEAPDITDILAGYNMTMEDVQALVAEFMGGGDEPTMIGDEPAMGTEVPVDMSSSAILSMSLIALASAHAVAFVTGMW